jgi:DNA adenine methylase
LGRPLLRWAGSKRQIVPTLARYWDSSFSRYVEPFAGSAGLFFHLAPSRALLGDINAELIGTYAQLRRSHVPVYRALKALKGGRRTYNRLRMLDPSSLSQPARAARFIYLNHFCFNGLYRTNRLGRFNVPYGGERTGPLPGSPDLARYSKLLQRATLVSCDFERVLERVKPGDFVYLDPPFSVRARRVFHQYDATAFGTDDLRRLRSWMKRLDDLGVSFLVSFADSDEARYLRRGFHTRQVQVKRSIAGFATKRVYVTELLISNRLPPRSEIGA